ncbi:Ankyrin repeat-containing domain [Plasmopara halstedii]|uniref:Ankyrin repeat-containing domain n=1 Tax=Plasmopara halstedii TaxID=4781 RepID=A0A0N7L379_PLAHL|nr:Ankyrin repeat-containing domain [Plasmopara halstedii]CEG35123.1 Ankyrin repeat-containing domain [Plasmopara halstedii]|eukprot:XP_024571492.1 Ankyrin repeat-containing domain [Plasmopara halstedii]
MTNVSTFVRNLIRKIHNDNSQNRGHRELQLRLRKAVKLAKVRQVAELLHEGASPIWMERKEPTGIRFRRSTSSCQLNALLLACRVGNDEVLGLLLDVFVEEPQVLIHFSRAMYCLVIRHNHSKAFYRLQKCRVPVASSLSGYSTALSTSPSSVTSARPLFQAAMEPSNSKLPMPIFVAAQHGRHRFLAYLLEQYQYDWAQYTFENQSLLCVATTNGQYECVRELLTRQVADVHTLDAAVALARHHRQAHVLVLLTSYISESPSSLKSLSGSLKQTVSSKDESKCRLLHTTNRGSMAETVISDFEDDYRPSSLVANNSPINFDNPAEDFLDHDENMPMQASIHCEQQQGGMMWFLDGREPIEEMQRRVDPYGVSTDNFVILQSARESTDGSQANEEEEWYAVKSSEKNYQHDNLSPNDEDEDSYESMFFVYKEQEQNTPKEQLHEHEEKPKLQQSPQSSLLSRSGKSRKLISVRSRKFQQQSLEAIEEHPAGETEAQ